jgi:hypothetical protein
MSNTNNALTAVSRDEWSVMTEQASMLVKTGFLPKDINTPEKAIAIMLKGRELNVPAMHALSTITVIQGKPTVSPELMAALVERDYGSNALIVEHTTDEQCVVSCLKPGWDKRRIVEFTIEEAKRAGLLSNQTWQKYPAAMLRSRAISKACKTHFQASIGGMYTPEELGASVEVIDGEVVFDHAGAFGDEPEPRPAVHPEATPRQIKYLHAVAREAGLSHDDLHNLSVERFGVGISDLNRRQAPELIEELSPKIAPHMREPEPTPGSFSEGVNHMTITVNADEPEVLDIGNEIRGILTDLKAVDDRRDLSAMKVRIREAGLDSDEEVKGAYNAAYNRLRGAQEPSDAGQGALPV